MKVLVVDDVRLNRIFAVRVLEKRGHTVQTADNGAEAISRMITEDFDIVLLDINMPIMNGIQVAKFIRDYNSPVRQHDVPIIAFSAPLSGQENEEKVHCMNAGINKYLSKPAKAEELLSAVEHCSEQN